MDISNVRVSFKKGDGYTVNAGNFVECFNRFEAAQLRAFKIASTRGCDVVFCVTAATQHYWDVKLSV